MKHNNIKQVGTGKCMYKLSSTSNVDWYEYIEYTVVIYIHMCNINNGSMSADSTQLSIISKFNRS